jgi:hypothetical protein
MFLYLDDKVTNPWFGRFLFFLEDKWNKLESELSKMNVRNDNWARR